MATAKKKTTAGSPDRAAVAKKVLEGMHGGLSCFKACQAAGVPHSTFLGWVGEDAKMADNYTRAREDLIEHIASETLEIADQPVGSTENGSTDSGAVQKQRLQVDTRKWILSKLAPKKYGDRMLLAGDENSPLQIEKIERVVVK